MYQITVDENSEAHIEKGITRPSEALKERAEEISCDQRENKSFMVYHDCLQAEYTGPKLFKDFRGAFNH